MTNPSATEAVAEEVRALLARRRVTHKTLEGVLGLSRPTLGKRLSGAAPFTVTELDKLAGYFDVPITDFFGPNQSVTHRSAVEVAWELAAA